MSPKFEDIARALEAFIRSEFEVPADDPLFGRDVNLWEEGFVDSPGVVEVIAFLEEGWSVEIPQETLFLPDFTCIHGMARAVAELCEARDPAAPSERRLE